MPNEKKIMPRIFKKFHFESVFMRLNCLSTSILCILSVNGRKSRYLWSCLELDADSWSVPSHWMASLRWGTWWHIYRHCFHFFFIHRSPCATPCAHPYDPLRPSIHPPQFHLVPTRSPRLPRAIRPAPWFFLELKLCILLQYCFYPDFAVEFCTYIWCDFI